MKRIFLSAIANVRLPQKLLLSQYCTALIYVKYAPVYKVPGGNSVNGQILKLKKHFYSMDMTGKGDSGYLDPPENVREMKNLDILAFDKTVKIPYMVVEIDAMKNVFKILKSFLLKLSNLNPVQDIENKKLILLNPLTVKTFEDFTDVQKNALAACGLGQDDLLWKDVKLNYTNWKADTILKAVLPLDQTGVSGYSIIGHILHLNLKEHLNDYKKLIGQVLLDKTSNITTVVNKVDTIDSTYRTFNAEVLAGEENLNVSVKEHGVRYEFNFAEVYWNPRLCTEHSRIVSKLNPGDILYDVFAGVGPFAIPAAKKQCTVIANDLNPHAFKWLNFNVKLNKVEGYVKTYSMDGREFIQKVLRTDLVHQCDKNISRQVHITMNLPALAIEFLDSFKGLFSGIKGVRTSLHMPWIHCYCFTPKDDMENALQMVESKLECCLGSEKEIAFVRSVAPNKDMVRVSFQIPEEAVLGKLEVDISQDEPAIKKSRIMNEDS